MSKNTDKNIKKGNIKENSTLKTILLIFLGGLIGGILNFFFIVVSTIAIEISPISSIIYVLWFLLLFSISQLVLKDKRSLIGNILASIIVISLFYKEVPIYFTVFFILLVGSGNVLGYKKFKNNPFFTIGVSICILIIAVILNLNQTLPQQEWITQEKAPQGRVTFGKPVIYFYPTTESKVNVRLDLKGKVIADLPKYDKKIHGWNITAFPDGKIINSEDKKEYSYLFWEGINDTSINWDFSTGFVVAGKDSREFLQDILPKLGLTPKEYNEFIIYWYPLLQKNPYNLIHFAGTEYTNSAKLTITPTPDSLLRVFMVYKPLQEKIDVPEQKLPVFERKGFSVVEWGGSEVQ